MMRVLITGMSGTGKSSVIAALAARGYRAIDTDYDGAETGPDGDWVWNEERLRQLLSSADSDVVFLSGCVSNQGEFYPQFDHVILLSTPADVIVERLRTRTNNPYGKTPKELALVLEHIATIEPLLRRTATHEINTDAPLEQVIAEVLGAAGLAIARPDRFRPDVSANGVENV